VATIELRTFIRASEEDIWAVISDLSGQQRWMEDISSLEVVSDVKSGVGTILNVTSKVFGLPVVKDVMGVVVWEEPRRLEVVHRGQFTGEAAFRLQPAPGGTIFIWREEFKPPLGPLGELAAALVVSPHLRRVWARSMDNVRDLAERLRQERESATPQPSAT
jgi:hypothetical protein